MTDTNERNGGDSRNSDWVISDSQDWYTPRVVLTDEKSTYSITDGGDGNEESASQSAPAGKTGESSHHGGVNADYEKHVEDAGNEEEIHERREDYDTGDDLGHVSENWKRAVSCLLFGNLSFILSILAFIAFTISLSSVWLYVIAVMTLLYTLLRFGFSYYIYQDAKKIRYHTKDRRGKPWHQPDYGWLPRPFIWAMFMFVMPPFTEFGPATAYFYRRHRKTGVP